MNNDPEHRDRRGHEREEPTGNAGQAEAPQPFDTSDLENIPHPQEGDPPYRDWWVVKDQWGDREPAGS